MSELLQLEGFILDESAGMRFDQALAHLFPDYSRGQLTKWIKAGYVTLDKQQVRPRDSVLGGEHVIINATIEKVDETWTAENIALDIIHEDDDVLIINKEAGMVVHPGAGNHNGTLVNALLNHAPQLEGIPRAGIVHRIDKGTTGLLMIAKTLIAHNSLVLQLQDRSVLREYQAIAMGVMTSGGTVDENVGRHPIDRKRMAVTGAGKPAITHYRVEKRYRAHTHIRCKLETGRTHQIRVHMAHIRYPLLGDPVYGGRLRLPKGASEATKEALQGFRRQALHAGLLGFIHPGSDQEVSWRVDMPEDMQNILAALDRDQKEAEFDALGL
ncbi:MAG: 23S rRNA pseudouridine(1911/1915/1917) synthase RluD [Gammaproteobacteria bacterium]|nr:MAG: 23S rRNA pseudouridine(1911/1915/1917) synthase RluD [Gammaproteobacteria bacterium]